MTIWRTTVLQPEWGLRRFPSAGIPWAVQQPQEPEPKNTLFDAHRNIRTWTLDSAFSLLELSEHVCGTLLYAAPELFLGQRNDGPTVDVWSLVEGLYKMRTGTLCPLYKITSGSRGSRYWMGKAWCHFSFLSNMKNTVKKCMTLDPKNRECLKEIVETHG